MHVTKLRTVVAGCALSAALGMGGSTQAQDITAEIRPVASDEQTAAEVEADVDIDLVGNGDEAAPVDAPADAPLQVDFGVARVAEPGYWIGMQLEPPSDALRSQLGIADGQGLVIAELFPDTPAVKAGFAKHDLVLKVGDAPVTDIEVFNKVVQDTKGEKELTITLLRAGKRQTINVTPAKRPGDNALAFDLIPGIEQNELLYRWIPKGVDLSEGPMHLELFHPGVIVERERKAMKIGDLPADLSISISKSGDKPAEISVKKGHIKWDVTEKELDKLPADVRPHVETMLRGGGPVVARLRNFRSDAMMPPMVVMPPRPTPPMPVAPPAAAPRADVQQQLDEVNKRLEDLQKALDALVKERTGGDAKQ